MILVTVKTFFICSAFILGGFAHGVLHAQNANSTQNTQEAKRPALKQDEISRMVRNYPRRRPAAPKKSTNPKNPTRFNLEELKKSQQIEAIVRQGETKDAKQSALNKKIQDLVVKLQPETSAILKKIDQDRQEALKKARLSDFVEHQKQLERINEESRKKIEKYFKDVVKNLPQKGKHQDYTQYNQQFRPIVRK